MRWLRTGEEKRRKKKEERRRRKKKPQDENIMACRIPQGAIKIGNQTANVKYCLYAR